VIFAVGPAIRETFSFGIDWRGGGERGRGIPRHRKSNPLFADRSGESFAMTIMQDGVLYARSLLSG
jgi:hypothetical protein